MQKKKIDAYSLQAQKCEVRMPLPTGPFSIVMLCKRALSLTYGFQPVQKKKKKYAKATNSFIIKIYFYLRREVNEMIRTSLSCVLLTTH